MNQHEYQIGQEVVPGYTLVRPLGKGMAGDVWVARGAGGTYVAVKIVRSLSVLGGRKELKALKTIHNVRHPNLCPLHGFWTKDADGRLLKDGESDAMVSEEDEDEYTTRLPPAHGTMEAVGLKESEEAVKDSARTQAEQLIVVMGLGDCTLHDRLSEVRREAGLKLDDRTVACGLKPSEIIHYLRPAADAIDELNQQHSIYHCDIKPQNILIVGRGAQVCDFGLASRIEGDSRTTHHPFATPAYAAPEVLDKMSYSRSVDQYSLAVTFYELRTGLLPFDASSMAKMLQAKCSGKLDLSCVSSAERRALQKAMHVDPAQRFATCTELMDELAAATGVDRTPRITLLRLCVVGLVLTAVVSSVVLAFRHFRHATESMEVATTAELPPEQAQAELLQDSAIDAEREPVATSNVRINVDVPDAVVRWEDRQHEMEGTTSEITMSTGTHSIKIEKPGYEIFVEPAFVVRPDEENELNVELVPLKYPIVIQTDPPDTQLTWNGTLLHRGEDNTVWLPLGTHQIQAQSKGFKSIIQTIVVVAENNDGAVFELVPIEPSIPKDVARDEPVQQKMPLLQKEDEARFVWLFARYGIRSLASAEISEQQLTQALALDPSLGQAYRDRAISRSTIGKTKTAQQDFEQAIDLLGENFLLRQEYAKMLARMSATAEPSRRDAILEDCKKQCVAALEIRPHATGPRLLLAELLFQQEKNAESKREVEQLREESIDPEQRSYAWNLLGLIALREGEKNDAFSNFKSAIAANPDNAEAHLNLANANREFSVGAKQIDRTESLQLALSHYTQSMQVKPQLRLHVLPLIAQVQEEMGRYESAIGTYTNLIEEFGPNAGWYGKRASLYERIGNAGEATKNRARALELQGKEQ